MAEISNSDSRSVSDPDLSQRWVMLSVMLGTGTVSLSNSSLNPAIPQLMQDFQIVEAAVSWVVVVFLLTMSLSLLLTGFKPALWSAPSLLICIKYFYVEFSRRCICLWL